MAADDVPEGVNLNDNEQPAILGTVIVTWLLLLLTFGGRIVCRRILHTPLRLDDWLIIPAVVFATLESLVIVAYSKWFQIGPHGLADGFKWPQTI
jgi:hypothetical protein